MSLVLTFAAAKVPKTAIRLRTKPLSIFVCYNVLFFFINIMNSSQLLFLIYAKTPQFVRFEHH